MAELLGPKMVICTTCGQELSSDNFYFDKRRNIPTRKCKKCAYEYTKKWRKQNPEKTKEIKRIWFAKNIDKERKRRNDWRKNNADKFKISQKKSRDKYLSTERGSICNRMRASIYDAIMTNKNGRKWESLVGYTVNDLKNHLESQFKDGMSWQHFIDGDIHIDHIIPISFFNYKTTDDVEFKMCWRLENLQPLWKSENLIKGDKIMRIAI